MMKLIFLGIIICLFSACRITYFGDNQLGIWELKAGEVVPVDTLDHNDLAAAYWDLIESMLPVELLDTYAVSLNLFTDGADGYLAAMSSLNDSNTRWQVYIDTFDVNFRSEDSLYILDYTHTIIHEFGHLLTLNGSQIEVTEDVYQDNEKGYLTNEGYATPNSYLGLFVEAFWPPIVILEWDYIMMMKNERKRARELYWFYLNRSEEHVTPYSAESPEEDIAESWTFFVLSDKPTKEGGRYDKVRFFYEFEELVAYRDEIRSKLKFIPEDYLERFNPLGPNYDAKN